MILQKYLARLNVGLNRENIIYIRMEIEKFNFCLIKKKKTERQEKIASLTRAMSLFACEDPEWKINSSIFQFDIISTTALVFCT